MSLRRRPGANPNMSASWTPDDGDVDERVRLTNSRNSGTYETSAAGVGNLGERWDSLMQQVGCGSVVGVDALRGWMSVMFNQLYNWLPWMAPDVTSAELEGLEPFARHAEIAFSHADENHARVLHELWAAFNPDEPLEAAVSERWTQYGFQQKDPASDFRAAGVFGIHNLLFFAEAYPDAFRKMSNDEARYPFAIAGLNITMMLLALLDLTGQKTCFHTTHANNSAMAKRARKSFVQILLQEAERHKNDQRAAVRAMEAVFGQTYCMAFKVLDKTWFDMKAGPMQFNEVLKSTKAQIDAILAKCTSVEDIAKHAEF